jgi:HK97 family phage prohead protease
VKTLSGHFAVFNEFAEVNNRLEGHFLERIAPGAFTKTFREQRSKMKVLFEHGLDSNIGKKPLGEILDLHEDGTGAFYRAQLLDTSYNRELIPGLEAGLYGASMLFWPIREKYTPRPARSTSNPDRLPERELLEVGVREFGPCSFGVAQRHPELRI